MVREIKARQQQKIDTLENWKKAVNFIPLSGEMIVYSDLKTFKIGDGKTLLADLEFSGKWDENFSSSFGKDTIAEGRFSFATGYEESSSDAVVATNEEGTIVYVSSEDCVAAASWPTKTIPGTNTKYTVEVVDVAPEGYVETVSGDFVKPEDILKTVAIGSASLASGLGAVAYSRGSKSLGCRTQTGYPANEEAVQDESHIILDAEKNPIYKTEDDGRAAVALGTDTKALGKNALTAGYRTQAIGNNSVAIGNGTQTLKDSCFAAGSGTIASGAGAFAIGGMQEDEATEASGNSAFAAGRGTKASGVASHTQGISTIASAAAAHAEGRGSQATKDSAHAEGCDTKALAPYSHTEGFGSQALGQQSHAEGINTESIGANSHAEGSYAKAIGIGSHAEGHGTIAEAQYQHVQGKYNIKDTEELYAHIVGNGLGDTTRRNAHTLDWDGNAWFAGDVEGKGHKLSEKANSADIKAAGYATKTYTDTTFATKTDITAANYASKDYVDKSYIIAGKKDGTTLGARATAEGIQVKASGDHSHAEGHSCEATGSQAHAEGYSTYAYKQATHAEGAYSKANARFAHAEGYYSEAKGEQSHAEGNHTIAAYASQHAQGRWNIEDKANKYAHIVGNGDENARSNAHTLDWKGKAWFSGDMKLGGTSYDDANAKRVLTTDDLSFQPMRLMVVETLPTENIEENAIYMVLATESQEDNIYDEFIYVNGAWEYIGNTKTEIDLDDYIKISSLGANKIPYTDNNGKLQTQFSWTQNPYDYTFPLRYTAGRLKVGTPVEDADATTKAYVDGLVGDIESALGELHIYAQSLIGGE